MRTSWIARLALAAILLTNGCVTHPKAPAKVVLAPPTSQPAAKPLPEAPATIVTAAPLAGHATPPPALEAALRSLALGFDGKVGIAVEDLREGWIVDYDGYTLYPQQSVAKLWVCLAVFDAADRGLLALNDPITASRADMSVFNQPIQKLMVDGAYTTTVEGLMLWAIAQSDNAANDILLNRVGGPAAVAAMIERRGLGAIRASPPEHELESRIAGLEWRSDYSFGQAFWTARDKVPREIRAAKLEAYIADPEDGASPVAIVDALARLQRGELLSPAATARFLEILGQTMTGPLRLKAGLGPGWTIAHKTGTGQDLGDMTTGYNDVAIITAPDGHAYAVAVMIARTRRPVPERQTLMATVAHAVVMQHDGGLAATDPASPPR